jgi:hypothetical protein
VAKRDQIRGSLGGHDPRDLSRRKRVTLRQLAQAPQCVRGHPHLCPRDRASPRESLAADIDHLDGACLVDVRELAHG